MTTQRERVSIALTTMPPSLNNMFINVKGKGRVRSANYRKWAEESGWLLKSQRPAKFDVPVAICIELNPQTGRSFDLDNRMKACIDLLVTHGVIPDDNNRWVKDKRIREVTSGAPVTIIVEAL